MSNTNENEAILASYGSLDQEKFSDYSDEMTTAAGPITIVFQESTDSEHQDDKDISYNKLSAFLVFLFPAIGGLLFGYDIGATSAVITQLESKLYSGVLWYEYVANSSVLQGIITSIGMFGAMFGSIICFQIADYIGRRRVLLIASILFGVGAIIETLSGVSSWITGGIYLLVFGRLVYGLGCGFAMNGAPSYIGEMAPSSIRGLLLSMKEAFIVLGMVLGYTLGYVYSETPGGWRWTYGLSAPIALVMFAGMYFILPFSARWLALKGRLTEAKKSMQFVTPNIPESELQAIREVALKAAESQRNTTLTDDWNRMTSPTVYPALVAGVGLVLFQQITGQPSVLYYADSIFTDIGLDMIASIGVSVFKLIATLIATFTVDKYGRKLLLYIGCSLMLAALIVLSIAFLFPYTSASQCYSFTLQSTCPSTCTWNTDSCGDSCKFAGYGYDDYDSCTCCDSSGINTQKSFILTALFIYIGGYQVGFGPVSWLLISELFPLEVRGKAVSIAVVTNFFFNTIMSFIFPIELELFGASVTFFLYGVVLVLSVYFIYYKVPETKGLSLEEIEEFFLRSSHVTRASTSKSLMTGSDRGDDERDPLVPNNLI